MSNKETNERQTPTNVEKLRGLPWGVAWSAANAVFSKYTFFGSVFVLYLSQLGLDKGQIGGLLSLLPFLGVVAVFIASSVARMGTKKVFLLSWIARTTFAICLLLVPMVLGQFGSGAAVALVVFAVAGFGLFRATGLTAFYPWQQEQVPDSVRGKFTAVKNVLVSLASLLALTIAGWVLGPDPELGQFLVLIAVGVVFGYMSVWTATKIPGGAPSSGHGAQQGSLRSMVEAARDGSFVRYLLGASLVIMAMESLISFVPLFMKEEVGLNSGHVVWLDTGVLLGGLISAYLWGWLADRYGSKPIMALGVLLFPLLPLAWILMPRGAAYSVYLALVIAFAQGLFATAWTIGSGRLLYVSVVPDGKRTAYMALYYAWMGVAGGLAQLFSGWLLSLSSGLRGQWWVLSFDPYTPLFVLGIILPLVAYALFRRVRADSEVTGKQFASLFFRGNPLLAMGSLVGFHRARDERSTVAMTERLGSTRSPLTVEELLEALHDPRFFVRFEAIVSIARHGPDPRLTEALIEVLNGKEPALSTTAAWALGRSGDEEALEALRQGLHAPYLSVQAHCARSLASLGDESVLPILLERLESEEDVGLQLAYASAAGKLGATEATGRLFDLLHSFRSIDARRELSLALARLAGEEHRFIQLQRRAEDDPGTTFSQEATDLRERLSKAGLGDEEMEAALEAELEAAADALARNELAEGLELLGAALRLLSTGAVERACSELVVGSMAGMEEFGMERIEYVILTFHALECQLED